MHEDHDVSCRARRKDTLNAEHLGILLEIRLVYLRKRTSAGSNEPANVLFCLHRQLASYAARRRELLVERLPRKLDIRLIW